MKMLLLALAAFLAGCASHQFGTAGAEWKTRTGQIQYREGDRSIVGELVYSSDGKNAKLEFTKGPGLALMRVQRDATHARFEGPLARLSHTISLAGTPSGRDAAWLEVLARAERESRFQVNSEAAKMAVQLAPQH